MFIRLQLKNCIGHSACTKDVRFDIVAGAHHQQHIIKCTYTAEYRMRHRKIELRVREMEKNCVESPGDVCLFSHIYLFAFDCLFSLSGCSSSPWYTTSSFVGSYTQAHTSPWLGYLAQAVTELSYVILFRWICDLCTAHTPRKAHAKQKNKIIVFAHSIRTTSVSVWSRVHDESAIWIIPFFTIYIWTRVNERRSFFNDTTNGMRHTHSQWIQRRIVNNMINLIDLLVNYHLRSTYSNGRLSIHLNLNDGQTISLENAKRAERL